MSTPKIVVHTEKKTLVVSPSTDFLNLKFMVSKLDICPFQVWEIATSCISELESCKRSTNLPYCWGVQQQKVDTTQSCCLLAVLNISITNIWFIQFIHNSIHKSQTGLATGILHQLEQSNWHIDKSKWNHNQIAGLSFLDIFGLQPFSQNCSFEKGTSHRDPAKSSTLQVHP